MNRHVVQYENQIAGDKSDSDEADIDELMEHIDKEFENDNAEQRYRESRMQQMADYMRMVERNVKEKGYGKLSIADDEDEAMKLTVKEGCSVLHFEHENFAKCMHMNDQLSILSRRYLNTRFLRINVNKAPFLVDKLKVKVLPLVLGFRNGQETVRIIGFDKLGNNPEGFDLERLEDVLKSAHVLSRGPTI